MMTTILLSLAMAMTTAADGDVCRTDWRVAFPTPGLTCTTARAGIVIAPDADAAALARILDAAADSYRVHFAAPRRKAAVVSGGSVTAAQQALLIRQGFMVLPWLSAAQRRDMTQSAVRRQLSTARPSASTAELDALVGNAMAQIPAAGPGSETERGALAHELAHGWFRHVHDAGKTVAGTPGSPRYGSTAPDWLDEMAAVLAENDAITTGRRAALARYAAGSGDDGLYPLATYLTMEHPVLRAAAAAHPSAGAAGGARVLQVTGEAAKALLGGAANPARFYAQSRGFADFLIEASGDPGIFATIGAASARGETFESWLATAGAAHRLPTTLPALEARWTTWVRARA